MPPPLTDLCSAGSRDSALTNHGFQQARRLALHLRDSNVRFTHIFVSPLQRARRTAGAIFEAQSTPLQRLIVVPAIQEQDFGSFEGKTWLEGPSSNRPRPANFVDIETKDSVAKRADVFLDEHMDALWRSAAAGERHVVAVVSHGIFLSTLWRRILRRLPPKSVSIRQALQIPGRPISLEHIGGFSNTGYLELEMTRGGPSVARVLEKVSGSVSSQGTHEAARPTPASAAGIVTASGLSVAPVSVPAPARVTEKLPVTRGASSSVPVLRGWTTKILTINGREHLKGLKRTGGGVGSSKHDNNQKSIDSFFKRRKVD